MTLTKSPLRWLLCLVLLVLALFAGAKARGEVVNQDSLSRSGGEMRGSIMRVYPSGVDNSIVQLFSYSADLLATNVVTNETLRVLRIWNDHGKPRIDLRPQGQTNLTVRISSDRVEMPVMVMVKGSPSGSVTPKTSTGTSLWLAGHRLVRESVTVADGAMHRPTMTES